MGGKLGSRFRGAERVVIWHNPRCTKSRQALAMLRDRGIDPEVREYLRRPPDATEITAVLGLLGFEPRQLIRKKEAAYADLGLGDPGVPAGELIEAMAEHPILIERPVVIRGGRAALGRPPENLAALFE